MKSNRTPVVAPAYWTAPVLWRFSRVRRAAESGRGLPHSKTLRDHRGGVGRSARSWSAPVLLRFGRDLLIEILARAAVPFRGRRIWAGNLWTSHFPPGFSRLLHEQSEIARAASASIPLRGVRFAWCPTSILAAGRAEVGRMSASVLPERRGVVLPGDGGEMYFRKIPAGHYLRGIRGAQSPRNQAFLEEPRHRVELAEEFWLAETPVTLGQFAAGPVTLNPGNAGVDHGADLPVSSVLWQESFRFCEWLGCLASAQIPEVWQSFAGTLPSEAQWEYACRAGTCTDYHSGDGEGALQTAGWYAGNARGAPHPVRQFPPNGFGLHDLHGNVWEWCRDVWSDAAYVASAGTWVEPGLTGAGAGEPMAWSLPDHRFRALRGGSWDSPAIWCRSAGRHRWGVGGRNRLGGFRVCLVRVHIGRRDE